MVVRDHPVHYFARKQSNIGYPIMKVLSVALLSVATANAFTAFAPVARPAFKSITTLNMVSQDELKKQVGYKAVDDYVKSGMVVGLGTGSTAYFAVERVGMKLKSGELKDVLCIPTSVRTKEQAESLGIPLVTLDTHSKLDVAIDGADEVDPDLNLVKGGGGALLREKMVEIMADKFIVIGKQICTCQSPWQLVKKYIFRESNVRHFLCS
jgi:ribose 5-phosphate isomerase A